MKKSSADALDNLTKVKLNSVDVSGLLMSQRVRRGRRLEGHALFRCQELLLHGVPAAPRRSRRRDMNLSSSILNL
eukprot:7924684-Pyramimonas_sp.AAC.1